MKWYGETVVLHNLHQIFPLFGHERISARAPAVRNLVFPLWPGTEKRFCVSKNVPESCFTFCTLWTLQWFWIICKIRLGQSNLEKLKCCFSWAFKTLFSDLAWSKLSRSMTVTQSDFKLAIFLRARQGRKSRFGECSGRTLLKPRKQR